MTVYAHVEVADDVLVSLNGKLTIVGFYTADIVTAAVPQHVAQLVFIFHIRGEVDDVVREMSLRIELPGEAPRFTSVPLATGGTVVPPGKKRWFIRTPFVLQNVLLYPGEIKAAVQFDGGEADAGSIDITTLPNASLQPSARSQNADS